jgi:hypothetical protein
MFLFRGFDHVRTTVNESGDFSLLYGFWEELANGKIDLCDRP